MIADRYAAALFDLIHAGDTALLARLDGEFQSVVELIGADEGLSASWHHPVMKLADKQQLVRDIFGARLHPYLLNLLLLLLEKKRHELLGAVQAEFRKRCDATRRRSTVKVTSAFPMDEQQLAGLKSLLDGQLSKEVTLEAEVDPDLIGGLILQVEDQVVDGSLRGRLQALKLALK